MRNHKNDTEKFIKTAYLVSLLVLLILAVVFSITLSALDAFNVVELNETSANLLSLCTKGIFGITALCVQAFFRVIRKNTK